MKAKRINYCFFINDCDGGATRVVANIVKYGYQEAYNFRVIASRYKGYHLPPFEENLLNSTIVKYEYSNYQNRYFVLKKLAERIPDQHAVVVANDYLDLQMFSYLKLPNPLVFIVHGNYDYYYDLATYHEPVIDRFIAVNPEIKKRLDGLMPHRAKDIFHIPFPVPDVKVAEIAVTRNNDLKIIFVGRVTEEKGAFDLPKIDDILKKRHCLVKWTIIGSGGERLKEWEERNSNVNVLGVLPNSKVLGLYSQHDIIILPSRYEGFPVVIVEGMKAGLYPMVTNLEGLDWLIDSIEVGFTASIGDIQAYAEKIEYLHQNRNVLERLKTKSQIAANAKFNPIESANKYLSVFNEARKSPIEKGKIKPLNQSRLDNMWFPDKAVFVLRKLKRMFA